MKKLVFLSVFAASALYAGFGTADKQPTQYLQGSDGEKYQYVICTASDTGSYYQAGKKLVRLLGQDYNTSKMIARAETTDGSRQNYELMAEGVCNVIFMQGDHGAFVSGKDKSFFDGKAVFETDRTENVQLIMRKGMDEDDLQKKGAKVLVGLANSGGAASWTNMVSLEDGYGKATVVNGDIDVSALSDLKSGKVDAIIRTSHLSPSTDDLAKMIAKDKKIYFADLNDKDLNDKVDLGNGEQAIYKFVDTEVTTGFFATEAETLETKVLIVVDKEKMSKKQKNKILRVLTQNHNNLF